MQFNPMDIQDFGQNSFVTWVPGLSERIDIANLIHPDDQLYNALLGDDEDLPICAKYATIAACSDYDKPIEDRLFFPTATDEKLRGHILKIIFSAIRARPEKVRDMIQKWTKDIERDLNE